MEEMRILQKKNNNVSFMGKFLLNFKNQVCHAAIFVQKVPEMTIGHRMLAGKIGSHHFELGHPNFHHMKHRSQVAFS